MKRYSILTLLAVIALGACSELPTTSEGPALAPEATAERGAANRAPAPSASSITDIVIAAAGAEEAEFSLLLDAVLYIAETNPGSALIEGLFNDDQYTVFAPTDAAFGALVEAVTPLILENDDAAEAFTAGGPFAAIDALLGDGTVEAVVSYHVTDGRRAANSVVPPNARQLRTITTLLDGATFAVDSDLGITAVGNKATIEAANISASNGIIHVIDTVLLPIEL
ncbi:MAG: fasciclin domain-containing protein [Gemmatimonadales bacterium]|nr:MAG: fasciclin domain-containing protein [Gemmatimonadales bacterium]